MIAAKVSDIAKLDTYRLFAKNSESELVILIKESIKSLEYFQDAFKDAYEMSDYSRMKILTHSIASELFYLKADHLKLLLKDFLLTEENATKNMEHLLQILMETEDVLQFLKQNLPAQNP